VPRSGANRLASSWLLPHPRTLVCQAYKQHRASRTRVPMEPSNMTMTRHPWWSAPAPPYNNPHHRAPAPSARRCGRSAMATTPTAKKTPTPQTGTKVQPKNPNSLQADRRPADPPKIGPHRVAQLRGVLCEPYVHDRRQVLDLILDDGQPGRQGRTISTERAEVNCHIGGVNGTGTHHHRYRRDAGQAVLPNQSRRLWQSGIGRFGRWVEAMTGQ